MNYSKILKPKLVGAPYKIKECNSFYLELILFGFITQKEDMAVQLMVL